MSFVYNIFGKASAEKIEKLKAELESAIQTEHDLRLEISILRDENTKLIAERNMLEMDLQTERALNNCTLETPLIRMPRPNKQQCCTLL